MANLFLPYDDTKSYKLYDGILFPRNINSGKYICIIDANRGESPTTKPSKWLQLNAIGSGTVTSVGATISGALTVTGSPITNAGTLAFSWTGNNTQVVLGDGTLGSVSGGGTVTSIATTGLISGGTITTSGTITTLMNTNRLVGRYSAGTGIMQEIVLGTNLSLSGNTLNATGGISAVTADNGLTASTSTNIQLGGTLIQNTTVDGLTSRLMTFTSANNTSTQYTLYADNTSSVGNAFSSSSLNGLAGNFSINHSSNNTIQTVVKIERSSQTNPLADMGGAIDFYLETFSGGITYLSHRISSKWEDSVTATRSSMIEIYGVLSGTTSRHLALSSRGQLTLDKYGVGSFEDTPTYYLGVDSLGNVIEIDQINIGTVTSVGTAGLISGGTITSSGTITTSMNTNKLVGRGTAGVGIMEEITLGSNLSLSGTTLNVTGIPTVTPSALTKADDTNVTLTLSGTPSTALLQPTLLTLGWTGTLAIGRGGTGLNALGTALQSLRVNAGATALEYYTPTTASTTGSISITISGFGGVVSVGQVGGFLTVPFNGTITGWIISSVDSTGAALSGSCVIGTYKDTYANFPPTSADEIFSTKPTLTAQSKNRNLSPTFVGSGATVTSGDMIGFYVDSCTTCVLINVTLLITKT